MREERLEIDRARVSPADYPRFAGFAASVDEVQERRIELGR